MARITLARWLSYFRFLEIITIRITAKKTSNTGSRKIATRCLELIAFLRPSIYCAVAHVLTHGQSRVSPESRSIPSDSCTAGNDRRRHEAGGCDRVNGQ